MAIFPQLLSFLHSLGLKTVFLISCLNSLCCPRSCSAPTRSPASSSEDTSACPSGAHTLQDGKEVVAGLAGYSGGKGREFCSSRSRMTAHPYREGHHLQPVPVAGCAPGPSSPGWPRPLAPWPAAQPGPLEPQGAAGPVGRPLSTPVLPLFYCCQFPLQ